MTLVELHCTYRNASEIHAAQFARGLGNVKPHLYQLNNVWFIMYRFPNRLWPRALDWRDTFAEACEFVRNPPWSKQ